MKKTISSLLIILSFHVISFGQKSEIEFLLNESTTLLIPKNFEYFNLVNASFPTEFDNYTISSQELETLKSKFPDFPHAEFLSLAQNDSALVNWNDFQIKNAKVYAYENIPAFKNTVRNYHLVSSNISSEELNKLNQNRKPSELIVPIKKNWNQKRIDKECQSAQLKFAKNLKSEDQTYFWFSKPLISKNGYAMITLNESGKGATYIFKKVNGKWQNIFVFNQWFS